MVKKEKETRESCSLLSLFDLSGQNRNFESSVVDVEWYNQITLKKIEASWGEVKRSRATEVVAAAVVIAAANLTLFCVLSSSCNTLQQQQQQQKHNVRSIADQIISRHKRPSLRSSFCMDFFNSLSHKFSFDFASAIRVMRNFHAKRKTNNYLSKIK